MICLTATLLHHDLIHYLFLKLPRNQDEVQPSDVPISSSRTVTLTTTFHVTLYIGGINRISVFAEFVYAMEVESILLVLGMAHCLNL